MPRLTRATGRRLQDVLADRRGPPCCGGDADLVEQPGEVVGAHGLAGPAAREQPWRAGVRRGPHAGPAADLPLTTRDPAWTTDPYTLSRGNKSLLTVRGGEHFLGGISGYQSAETTDENPDRVALVPQVTLAYLRHVTRIDHTDWNNARAALTGGHPLGHLESK